MGNPAFSADSAAFDPQRTWREVNLAVSHLWLAPWVRQRLEFGSKAYCVGLGIFRRVLVPPVLILDGQSDVAGAVEIV